MRPASMKFIFIKYSPVKQAGFSLLELLIAMAIFAVLGVLAYSGLNATLTASQHTQDNIAHFKALQMTLRYLERDLNQLINRPVRDGYGDVQPALFTSEQPLLSLTYSGWRNPAGARRSTLQRIAYDLENETLVRRYTPLLDGAKEDQWLETPLLDRVSAFEVRFLDQAGAWQVQWPPLNAVIPQPNPGQQNQDPGQPDPEGQGQDVQAPRQPPLPRAIEVRLTATPWGEIRRVLTLTL